MKHRVRFSALRALTPAMPRPAWRERLRAALGVGLGLVICLALGLAANLYLRADLVPMGPLGATALLIMAIPNSPLAQPWSVIVGNTSAALIGMACVSTLPPAIAPEAAAALAVIAMMSLRALHPPAGAVAFLMAINPDGVGAQGLWFGAPIGLGSIVLVLAGTVYNRATGRVYPFRQTGAPETPAAARVEERTGLTPDALQDLLVRFNQTANLGVADLARLVAAAQDEAARQRFDAITCGEIMTAPPITVPPEAPLAAVAQRFLRHRIQSLPVTDRAGALLGVVTQADVIAALMQDTGEPPAAAALMHPADQVVSESLPVGMLLELLAGHEARLVAVTRDTRPALAGVVTRSDVIALLLPEAERAAPAPEV